MGSEFSLASPIGEDRWWYIQKAWDVQYDPTANELLLQLNSLRLCQSLSGNRFTPGFGGSVGVVCL